MPALLIALLALVPAGALLLRVNLRRFRFRLDQFRPAAPLAGLLPTDRDSQRQHNDLRAARDRWDARDTETTTTEHRRSDMTTR